MVLDGAEGWNSRNVNKGVFSFGFHGDGSRFLSLSYRKRGLKGDDLVFHPRTGLCIVKTIYLSHFFQYTHHLLIRRSVEEPEGVYTNFVSDYPSKAYGILS